MRAKVSVALLAGLAWAVAFPGPSAAQEDPLLKVTRDKQVIRMQLERGLVEERRALQMFGSATTPEALAELPTVLHAGYAKIRAAHGSIKSTISFGQDKSPGLKPARERLEQAMPLIRQARRIAQSGKVQQIDEAIERLQTAIALVEQARRMI
jgi:hypothetical protein